MQNIARLFARAAFKEHAKGAGLALLKPKQPGLLVIVRPCHSSSSDQQWGKEHLDEIRTIWLPAAARSPSLLQWCIDGGPEEARPNLKLVKKQWESFYCLHLAFNE